MEILIAEGNEKDRDSSFLLSLEQTKIGRVVNSSADSRN